MCIPISSLQLLQTLMGILFINTERFPTPNSLCLTCQILLMKPQLIILVAQSSFISSWLLEAAVSLELNNNNLYLVDNFATTELIIINILRPCNTVQKVANSKTLF